MNYNCHCFNFWSKIFLLLSLQPIIGVMSIRFVICIKLVHISVAVGTLIISKFILTYKHNVVSVLTLMILFKIVCSLRNNWLMVILKVVCLVLLILQIVSVVYTAVFGGSVDIELLLIFEGSSLAFHDSYFHVVGSMLQRLHFT